MEMFYYRKVLSNSRSEMRLKSLSNKELKEEILWKKVDYMVRHYERRYDGQTREEQNKEANELHDIYRKYWDEAYRRGLVDNNSAQMEGQKLIGIK